MQTPSHFLMTATLAKALPKLSMVKSAVLWGSIAPDLPLWGLAIGGIVYYHWMLGWSLKEASALMFDDLYFNNPLWIVSHNLLHAPILLILGLGFAWKTSNRWFIWFFAACLIHSVVDILTHVDDGPLIFFPLDWKTRFHSVISYYDPRYYGREFSLFERSLNLIFLIYLLASPASRYLRKLVQTFSK
jgi:LexA-binding, inner membrane-associated putative hydrolase